MSNAYIFTDTTKNIVNINGPITLTAAQLFGPKTLFRITAATTITLPTYADIVSIYPAATSSSIGTTVVANSPSASNLYKIKFYNTGAFLITFAVPASGSFPALSTLPANTSGTVGILIPPVSAGLNYFAYVNPTI